jgi:release factor H-coupled RctB family protein
VPFDLRWRTVPAGFAFMHFLKDTLLMGNSQPTSVGNSAGRAPVHVFYSDKSWIEGAAVQQLDQVASLPGIKAVAAMPDLHPGKYGPVGCAILADNVHPHFVGSDIGCGMGLFQLDILVRKFRTEKVAGRLAVLDEPWDGDIGATREEVGLAPTPFDASLGSIGGGNHFCELQAIEEILSPETADRAGLDPALTYILVHSGSRGLGYAMLERQLAAGTVTLDRGSDAEAGYRAGHDHAVRWAVLNRQVIARRAAAAARGEVRLIADLSHNFMEFTPAGVLHRKGAAPSDRGLVPIPGSRTALSYLAEPLSPGRPEALASLAHGAGRKYDRASMHGRVRTKKSDLAKLTRNPFGGMVLCEDRDLLVEEAGDAYKNVDRTVADLADFGLARMAASFRPLITFKTARGASPAKADRNWRQDPSQEDRR